MRLGRHKNRGKRREFSPLIPEKKALLGSFFTNLRKRKIFETLAAFIGSGWLTYEVVHWVLVEHYHFPEFLLDITILTFFIAWFVL